MTGSQHPPHERMTPERETLEAVYEVFADIAALSGTTPRKWAEKHRDDKSPRHAREAAVILQLCDLLGK